MSHFLLHFCRAVLRYVHGSLLSVAHYPTSVAKVENSFGIIKKRDGNFEKKGVIEQKKAEKDHHGYFRHRFFKVKSGLRTLHEHYNLLTKNKSSLL